MTASLVRFNAECDLKSQSYVLYLHGGSSSRNYHQDSIVTSGKVIIRKGVFFVFFAMLRVKDITMNLMHFHPRIFRNKYENFQPQSEISLENLSKVTHI